MRSLKCVVAGSLALASAYAVTTEAQAMPVQTISSTATTPNGIEHVWWRGGWGWRGGYGWRGRWGGPWGYGWRRPWGAYGYRPYAWGWRRPYGYYGWRRW